MKRKFAVMVIIAVCLTGGACSTNPPEAAASGKDHSLGSCTVALNAPEPCIPYRGKTATGVAPGCFHDDCTAAKQNARNNLLSGIPAQCGAYIQCNDPCRCIKK